MNEALDTARLIILVKAALSEADEQQDALIGALLLHCIETIERRSCQA